MQNTATTDINTANVVGDIAAASVAASTPIDGASAHAYTFHLDSADIDANGQAHPAPRRLTEMVLRGAGYPTSCRDLPATMAALSRTYGHEVTEFPDLLCDSTHTSGIALICARHALAHLAQPFADLTEEDRQDLVYDNFLHVGPHADEARFGDWLVNILDYYTGAAYDQGWTPVRGVVPADVSMSMPVWRTSSGKYVCDLLTFLHPTKDAAEVDELVDTAFQHAIVALGPSVLGIRVIPLCGEPTRLHFTDPTEPPLDTCWRPRFSLDLH